MTNKHKAQLIMITTFILGVIVGGSGEYLLTRQTAPPQPGTTQEIIEDLSRKVGLDETQRAKIEAILEETKGRYDTLRNQVRPQFEAIRDDARRRVRELLSPEQQTLYDQWNREQDALKENKKK
jgi:hypothetical protein